MRSDARRNRDELLCAARALFIERGPDVALEAVAQRAGVSIATLYRNFPDRTALVRSVVLNGARSLRRVARQAHTDLAQDPAGAWHAFILAAATLQAGVLMPMLLPMLDFSADAELVQAREDAVRDVDTLVSAAQQHGQVRADVSAHEIMLLIMAIARPLPALSEERVPVFIERALTVAVDGLRPGTSTGLPGRPVPMQPFEEIHGGSDGG